MLKISVELGTGFAFMGRQYHLMWASMIFYIDLLFYHARLHCYVVIELKERRFQAGIRGKSQFLLFGCG